MLEKNRRIELLCQGNWYACTTLPRGEKIADKALTRLNIDHFLPLIRKTRKWSDREKEIQFPLFGGYIFINYNIGLSKMRRRILQAPKIAYLVQKEGIPLAIPSDIIESLKIIAHEWNENFEMESIDINKQLKEGDAIKIIGGPLKGVKGKLLTKKNFPRIVVFVEAIGQGVSIEVDLHHVEKMTAFDS